MEYVCMSATRSIQLTDMRSRTHACTTQYTHLVRAEKKEEKGGKSVSSFSCRSSSPNDCGGSIYFSFCLSLFSRLFSFLLWLFCLLWVHKVAQLSDEELYICICSKNIVAYIHSICSLEYVSVHLHVCLSVCLWASICSRIRSHYMSVSPVVTDLPFNKFRASSSWGRRILCTSGTSVVTDFGAPKPVKGRSGCRKGGGIGKE